MNDGGPASRLLRRLACLRLNEVEPRRGPDGTPWIAKRHRRFARPIIALANVYLNLSRAGVRVPGDRLWHAWEREANRHLHGVGCRSEAGGWLLMPRWPGLPLAEYAGDGRSTPEGRLRGLEAATLALREAHRVTLRLPEGGEGLFSHGDATLHNVAYDPSTGTARWYDFDTVHAPGLPAVARHADDLRALLASAFALLPDAPAPVVFDIVAGAYDGPETWAFLRGLVARGMFHRAAHHRAQATPGEGRLRELETLLGTPQP
ncbi:hypothetical protein [Paludisphaera soli]|uniref:hypothetical protein n=1 Tax=Paludisphaera soli TaxID=2712865 RepID=UPI0013EC43D1|nr:hypothetical protein [Paludisphaera soli]